MLNKTFQLWESTLRRAFDTLRRAVRKFRLYITSLLIVVEVTFRELSSWL